MSTRINGKIYGWSGESDWFVEKRHCARATYKHKTAVIDRDEPRACGKTLERAMREAEYAATLPEGISDSAYMAAMQAKFGGEETDPQADMFEGGDID